MTPEEFREYGHAIVDAIADYRATLPDRAVMAPVAPGELKAKLPAHPPHQAERFDAILRERTP